MLMKDTKEMKWFSTSHCYILRMKKNRALERPKVKYLLLKCITHVITTVNICKVPERINKYK